MAGYRQDFKFPEKRSTMSSLSLLSALASATVQAITWSWPQSLDGYENGCGMLTERSPL